MAKTFSNYGSSTIIVELASGALTVEIAAGTAALFPNVTTAGGDTFQAVLEDVNGNWEVVICTNRDVGTDVLTITRAQEGSSAKTFVAGSRIEMRLTAEICAEFIQRSGDTMGGDLNMGGNTIDNAVIDAPTIDGGIAKGTTLDNTNGDSTYPIVVPVAGAEYPTAGGEDILTDVTGALEGHEHFPSKIVQEPDPGTDKTFADNLISEGSVLQYKSAVVRVGVQNVTVQNLTLGATNLFKKMRYTGGALAANWEIPDSLGDAGDVFFISNSEDGSITVKPTLGSTMKLRKRDGQTGDVVLSSGFGVVGFHKLAELVWDVVGDYE